MLLCGELAAGTNTLSVVAARKLLSAIVTVNITCADVLLNL